jgi:hypothetical protein
MPSTNNRNRRTTATAKRNSAAAAARERRAKAAAAANRVWMQMLTRMPVAANAPRKPPTRVQSPNTRYLLNNDPYSYGGRKLVYSKSKKAYAWAK